MVVEEEIVKAERKEKRVRALPAALVVFYNISMCFYSGVGVVEVLRWVLESLRNTFGDEAVNITTSGAISSARTRLGAGVMEALYRRVVKPVATQKTKGAFYNDLRLVAIDGSTLDLQDTATNAKHFGYPACSRGESAFPQLRFIALVEVATRVLFAVSTGAFATSETALAGEIIGELKTGMLCLADRLFYSFEFWQKAKSNGAELLWRVRNNLVLPVEKRLPDGSWLSTIYPDLKSRRKRCNGQQVRVIRYRLKGAEASSESYLLLTTLFDVQAHPALTLAGLYPQRWEIELAYDEFKTHLRGGRVVLRSKTPDLVSQEFYSFLLAHFCVRTLMHDSAVANDLDPDRLSFTHSVEVIKRKLSTKNVPFSPSVGEDNS